MPIIAFLGLKNGEGLPVSPAAPTAPHQSEREATATIWEERIPLLGGE